MKTFLSLCAVLLCFSFAAARAAPPPGNKLETKILFQKIAATPTNTAPLIQANYQLAVTKTPAGRPFLYNQVREVNHVALVAYGWGYGLRESTGPSEGNRLRMDSYVDSAPGAINRAKSPVLRV
jgi:hypothetical protein